MTLLTKSDVSHLDVTFLGQPFCDVESITLNTQRLDWTWLGQPFVAVPNGTSLIHRRAIYWTGTYLSQITDALIGTGKIPIVLFTTGDIGEETMSPNIPLIWDGIKIRELNTSTETLLI